MGAGASNIVPLKEPTCRAQLVNAQQLIDTRAVLPTASPSSYGHCQWGPNLDICGGQAPEGKAMAWCTA